MIITGTFWSIPFLDDQNTPMLKALHDLGFRVVGIDHVLCTVIPPDGWYAEREQFVPMSLLIPREDPYSCNFTEVAVVRDAVGQDKLRLSHFNNVENEFMNLDRGLIEIL